MLASKNAITKNTNDLEKTTKALVSKNFSFNNLLQREKRNITILDKKTYENILNSVARVTSCSPEERVHTEEARARKQRILDFEKTRIKTEFSEFDREDQIKREKILERVSKQILNTKTFKTLGKTFIRRRIRRSEIN
jgi:hypothetical protein